MINFQIQDISVFPHFKPVLFQDCRGCRCPGKRRLCNLWPVDDRQPCLSKVVENVKKIGHCAFIGMTLKYPAQSSISWWRLPWRCQECLVAGWLGEDLVAAQSLCLSRYEYYRVHFCPFVLLITKPNLLITRRVSKQLFPTYLRNTRDQQPSMSASLGLGLSQSSCRGICGEFCSASIWVLWWCGVCICCPVCKNILLKRIQYLKK